MFLFNFNRGTKKQMNEQEEAIVGIILLKIFSLSTKADKSRFDNLKFANEQYYQGYSDAIHDMQNQIKDLVKNQNILNTETFMKLKWLSKQHSLSIIQYLEYLINEIYEYEHDSHDVRQ